MYNVELCKPNEKTTDFRKRKQSKWNQRRKLIIGIPYCPLVMIDL